MGHISPKPNKGSIRHFQAKLEKIEVAIILKRQIGSTPNLIIYGSPNSLRGGPVMMYAIPENTIASAGIMREKRILYFTNG